MEIIDNKIKHKSNLFFAAQSKNQENAEIYIFNCHLFQRFHLLFGIIEWLFMLWLPSYILSVSRMHRFHFFYLSFFSYIKSGVVVTSLPQLYL